MGTPYQCYIFKPAAGFTRQKQNSDGNDQWPCNICEWDGADSFDTQEFVSSCESNKTHNGKCYTCSDYSEARAIISFHSLLVSGSTVRCQFVRYNYR